MIRFTENSTYVRRLSLRQAIAMVLAAGSTMGTLLALNVHAQEATSGTTTSETATESTATDSTDTKSSDTKKTKKDDDVANLSDVNVSADTLRAFSTEPSASSFGFAKPLQETPRAVSFVSEEQLSKFGIQSVQDLTRLVPGTYTTTRYGLQGAINIRTVTADQYYRGMKRLDQQGHVRTVLSAYDNIEVIKGPPSPVYGMGRIGGYTVLDPKSSRARTGKYMTEDQGYFQALTGSYKLSEIQFGEGVPFTVAGRNAGVYVVGLLENSEGWIKNVGAQQRFLQATSSVDRAVGPFRLEMGGQLQNSITSGSYMNRATQALVDHGTYITGSPMVNLDVNGDGRVGFVETYLASPVTGAISGNNQALTQRYTWKQDANGDPLSLDSFKGTLNGVPQNFKDYLNQHRDISCPLAVYMRDSAPVAVVNGSTGSMLSRNIPVGFYLNPCTVGTTQVDYRRNGSFERQQNAVQRMGYFDLIYDTDPNFTAKQQFFYDSIDSFKDSWLPYGERQYIKAWEDKVTLTKALPETWLPSWMTINTLGSVNYRDTRGFIQSSGGDFDYRQDIMSQTCPGAGCEGSGTGGHYPNTMFWTQLTNPSYATGAPITSYTNSQYSENGVGLMADITIFTHTNIVAGGRFDKVKAHVTTPVVQNPSSGNFSPDATVVANYIAGIACQTQGQVVQKATGTTVCPGGVTAASDVNSSQNAKSWSISISHELPWGHTRPYFTAATSSLALDGSNNLFSNSVVAGSASFGTGTGLVLGADGVNHGSGGKIIGEASLREYGIKGELFSGKAQWSADYFSQTRNDVSAPTDPSVGVEVTSTITKGTEMDFKYQITKKWYASVSAVHMTSQYLTGGSATNVEVSGRELGFNDIVDPVTGAVYPAEAFLYGGRTQLQLTDPHNDYKDVPGLPNWQGAFLTTYNLPWGFGLNASAQYLSKSWANRTKTVVLPQATLFDGGVTWDHKKTHIRFSAFNIADKRYFQGGPSTNGELITVMPGRRWQLQLKEEF